MRTFAVAAALLFSVSIATAASPYVGAWAAEELDCDEAIVINEKSLEGAENECRFDRVVASGDVFSMSLTCQGEGLPEEQASLTLKVAGAEMIAYFDNKPPIIYRRCN